MNTEEEFLKQMGDNFHIRLRIFYDKYTSEEEKEVQLDSDVLHYDFDERGKYSITFGDLKTKSNEETSKFLVRNDVKIKKSRVRKNK
jgi:hypothetical protein